MIIEDNRVIERRRCMDFEEINFPQFELTPLYVDTALRSLSKYSFEKIEKKGVYNFDTRKIVNFVSDRYHLVRHENIINDLEYIIAQSDLDLTGIDRRIVFPKDGNVMFASYNFPNIRKVMSDGDESNLQITAINSVDGTRSFELVIGAVRMMCENGQISLSRDASCKLKHFGNHFDHTLGKSSYIRALNHINNAANLYAEEVKTWEAMRHTWLDFFTYNSIFYDACGYKLKHLTIGGRSNHAYIKKSNGKSIAGGHPPQVEELRKIWKKYEHLDSHQPSGKELTSSAWRVYNTLTDWATHISRSNQTTVVNLQEKRKDIIQGIFKKVELEQVA